MRIERNCLSGSLSLHSTSLSIKSLLYFFFWSTILANGYRMIDRFSLSGLVNRQLFLSLSIKSLLYFEKIMCCLNRKYNRKKCVFKKRPIFPHSLLHYKVDIFSFLTMVLDMYCSTSERFLKSRRVIRLFSPYPLRGNFIFLEKYHSNIFIFIVIQRFLRIGLVIRQKIFPLLSIKG